MTFRRAIAFFISLISVSAAALEVVASPDRTELNNVFRSVRKVDLELSVLELDDFVALADSDVKLSSMLCSEIAAVWASVMSPDSADWSKLTSVSPSDFD